jgi:hypothetical protein
MYLKRLFWTLLLVVLTLLPTTAQENSAVQMRIEAGYDHYFRENFWIPIRIQLSNSGADIVGQLIIRPETSGRVVSNAYSTPIELPSGSEKTVFLYIQARRSNSQPIVELIDAEGVRIAQQAIGLEAAGAQDKLHVIISDAGAAGIGLNNVKSAGHESLQVNWAVNNLPDYGAALAALDTLWFVGADTEQMTVQQQAAVEHWVLGGGHLIITGGTNWQTDTAGLLQLMPLTPTDSEAVADLNGLAAFTNTDENLAERTVITTGDLKPSAVILAANADATPLLIRWQYGNGTVDFLAADPTLEPLRSWQNQAALWYQIATTGYPRPSWTQGIINVQQAATAMAILPGIELLPPVTSLLGYLLAYIILIGPANYIILNRLNRRGWAWITIPVCILAFSLVAWTVGFNLRGNEITVSRIQIVQTWQDSDNAKLERLISVLAPRRGSHTLELAEGQLLRVLPTLAQGGLLTTNNAQSTVAMVQTSIVSAQDFAVDGGIFANFAASGMTEKPAITGELTLTYLPYDAAVTDREPIIQTLQGFVRNDSEITLKNPMLLARGITYSLGETLEPGDLVTVDSSDLGLALLPSLPAAAPLELPYERLNALRETRESRRLAEQTITDILGVPADLPSGTFEAQQADRYRAVATAFLGDQFASTGRGNDVYLVGWSDTWANDLTLVDRTPIWVDTTLYLIQLAVTAEPSSEIVTVLPDQFTWALLEKENVEGSGPNDFTLLQESSLVIELTPAPDAVLRDVTELTLFVDRSSGYGRRVATSLWNWDTGEWFEIEDIVRDTHIFENPDAYLGANNRVRVRLMMDIDFASAWIRRVSVLQRGRF